MIDEHELRRLLRDHDTGDHALSADERRRVLERIGLAQSAPPTPESTQSPATKGVHVDRAVDIGSRPLRDRPRRHTRPAAIAAAALVVIALGAIVLQIGNRERSSVSIVADADRAIVEPSAIGTAPTVTPAPPCPAAVDSFVAGIDAWDGIDGWAALWDDREPDPDLWALGDAALAAWRAAAPGDVRHDDLGLEGLRPNDEPGEARREAALRRGAPLQDIFDGIRAASADDPTGPLGGCTESIENLAAELGAGPLDSPDG